MKYNDIKKLYSLNKVKEEKPKVKPVHPENMRVIKKVIKDNPRGYLTCETIVRRSGFGKTMVGKAVNELIDSGFLEVSMHRCRGASIRSLTIKV